MKYGMLALSLVLMLLASGCASLAKSSVQNTVRTQEQFVSSAKSRVTDPEIDQYVNKLGGMVFASARKLNGVDQPDFKPDPAMNIYDRFTVYPVNDVAPNAWVYGDDFACINTALIAFAESPEELAMILGHEFGHVRQGHMVNSQMRLQTTFVAAMVTRGVAAYEARGVTGEAKQQYIDNATQSVMAAWQPNNPPDEHEADEIGVAIMADLGLDLDRAPDFFVRIIPLYGDDGSASHPKSSERIKKIHAQVAALKQSGYVATRQLDQAEFLAIKERVKQMTRDGVSSKQIVFFSEEQQAAVKNSGGSAVVTLGCGPVDADPAKLAKAFKASMGLR